MQQEQHEPHSATTYTDSNFYTKHISTHPFQQGNMNIFKQTGKNYHIR